MASGNHPELNERRFRSMSTISTKSPCCANSAGDEADVEARGPDPGPEPIVPARGGGRSGPKGPGHPEGGCREAHSRPFSGNLTRFPRPAAGRPRVAGIHPSGPPNPLP